MTCEHSVGRSTLYAQFDRPERDAYVMAMEAMAGAGQTPRAVQNITAYLEERGPVWTGRSQRGPRVGRP